MTVPPPLAGALVAAALFSPSLVSALTVEVGGAQSLVSATETWSYFKGTAPPSAPAQAWREIGFDHSSWLTGQAGFGYGDGDDQTVLGDMQETTMQAGYPSVFLRLEFDLASVPDGRLELVVDYDDGFVAYLNGSEVRRSPNMPAGEPTFETTTDGSREAGASVVYDLGDASDHLVAGTNVLALSGHNASLDSSDFSLAPTLRLTSGMVQNGGAWVSESPSPALGGTVDSAAAVAVFVDGTEVTYDPATRQWSGSPLLVAGPNRILIEARDSAGQVLESTTLDFLHVPPGNLVAGTLIGDATWSGAVLVETTVTVPAGATLTIAPGTQVLFRPGAGLIVNGRLAAAGTADSPIRFTHHREGTTWERILLVGAEDSILAHCIVEFSDCEGDHKDYYDDDCDPATPLPARTYFQAVVAVACHLDIEDCLFHKLPDESGDAEGDAIAIISDDPDVPGVATANIRRSDFIGIGQGIHTRFAPVVVEECFFTGHNGDNDDIDLYGESNPPPLILNNRCINPGHDDMINPTRCSAILVGNVIAGSDDHGIVLRDKCRPVLINNLIYDCSSGGIAIQNQCDALLINNTIVNCGRGIRCFDHTSRWGPPYCLFPGSGRATLVNCIIRDCSTTFTLEDSPWTGDQGSHLVVRFCNVEGGLGRASVSTNSTVDWGAGNLDLDPHFLDAANGDFRLRSSAGRWDAAAGDWIADTVTSPCIDVGLDVRDTYPELATWLARDFDGLSRPLDGNADGLAGIDLGAHEVISEAADSSGDGIPDGWAFRYGLDPLDSALADGDPDRDSATTGEEWLADTDPTDSSSWFRISEITPGSPVEVHLASSAERAYTLFTSIDLKNWTAVEGQVEVVGNGGTLSLEGPSAGARRFYRVGVELP